VVVVAPATAVAGAATTTHKEITENGNGPGGGKRNQPTEPRAPFPPLPSRALVTGASNPVLHDREFL